MPVTAERTGTETYGIGRTPVERMIADAYNKNPETESRQDYAQNSIQESQAATTPEASASPQETSIGKDLEIQHYNSERLIYAERDHQRQVTTLVGLNRKTLITVINNRLYSASFDYQDRLDFVNTPKDIDKTYTPEMALRNAETSYAKRIDNLEMRVSSGKTEKERAHIRKEIQQELARVSGNKRLENYEMLTEFQGLSPEEFLAKVESKEALLKLVEGATEKGNY